MGLPKRLTEMQKRFAEYIVFNEGRTTGADAAIAAGYSEKRARVEASELQNPRLSPLVVQYIGALREEKLKKFEVTYDRHVAELGKIREAALKKGAFSAATNAEKNRGMAAGLYIDRKIIKTGKLEDLSEEELELKMKKSQKKIKNIIVEGISGSNSVKVTLNGDGEMIKIDISPETMKEEQSIIEDLIVAAHNNAKTQLKTKTSEEISKTTDGFGIPGFKWPL